MPIDPTNQSPVKPPVRPPGYLRRLWQALGRHRAGRLLRLAIIAVTGWVAVEATSGVSRAGYKALFIGDTELAVSYAIEYAFGFRVQTDRDVAAWSTAPAYPLPPVCLSDPQYSSNGPMYFRLDACLGDTNNPDPIFRERCRFGVAWISGCGYRRYHMHVLEHRESFERLVSAIKNPCRYLPSPETIDSATNTSEPNEKDLKIAWRGAGCAGSKHTTLFWTQLEFVDVNAEPNSPKRKIIMMIPTGE